MPGKKIFLSASLCLALLGILAAAAAAQNRPIKIAYSAVSAGIGTIWLTHEEGLFRKHGLDSALIYIPGGTIAVQALLAGELHFGHLSPAPMMTAWAQGADLVWIGTTVDRMVFTLATDPKIARGADLKGKKVGITRLGSASDLAARLAFEHLGISPKDVTLISAGGIPDILAALKAGAVQGGILSPPSSTIARDLGYRALVSIPDLEKDFTFAGIATKRSLIQASPEVAKAFMAALTEGAKIYKNDNKAALKVLKKYMRADEHTLEAGYKEYGGAISSPPYPSLKGLEALRQSLAETSPALRNADLKKFVDDRFVAER
jgi:NitT/TauT family transport system substrate-binding protein